MSKNFGVIVILISLATLFASCAKDSIGEPSSEPDFGAEDAVSADSEIWIGPVLSFTKAAGDDPTAETNQDRITENVWITRGNNGGQIYNAKSENAAIKGVSPRGTRWAVGTLSQVEELEFRPFRSAVGKPQNVVGKHLVLHLVDDNIYLNVKFTAWSDQKGGGFSYERSTAE